MTDFRPKTFDGIIGQENVKSCLKIAIQSAKERGDVLDHSLFLGSAGTGKTTLALATAHELNAKIYLSNGGNIKNLKDVLPYLSRLRRGDVLFIDEIHRVHTRVQESLFTVMEDFRLDVAKAGASINFEPFTIIGATTEAGMLLRPFYDRFIHHFMLEDYSIDELSKIISKNCEKIQVSASASAIIDMAKRSRFTPRIANSILTFCRDYAYCASASNRNHISDQVVESAMNLKKIDEKGLDMADYKYLNFLKLSRKPVGLRTITGFLNISSITIENQIEPYLLRLNLIEKWQNGRILTKRGYNLLD